MGRIEINSPKTIEKIYGAALLIFSFFWFYYPGEYVLIANQDSKLLITTPEYFFTFLDRPGGILEYLGIFLTQLFRFRIPGALIISGVVTLSYFTTTRLIRRISTNQGLLVLGIITPILIMGMHNHYAHQVHHSLGYIIAIWIAVFSPEQKIKRRIFLAIAVPVIYFVCGGYLWICCALVFMIYISKKRRMDIEAVTLIIIYPAVLVFLGSQFVYLSPPKELVIRPFPKDIQYTIPYLQYILAAWILTIPFLSSFAFKFNMKNPLWKILAATILPVAGLILVLNTTYNRKNAEFFNIEKLAVEQDWEGLLNYADRHPSMNLFGTFYTNMALAHTGKLCSNLFDYPQPFGTRGLCFEWEAKEEILKRGSDFFWTINFVNESHHWAYESLIVNGFTRRNLSRLIQTELVRGNYLVAEKYIHVLQHTLFDKQTAIHYRRFLHDREEIEKDSDLGPRLKTDFSSDFFTDGVDLERNLRSMITNDPHNRPVFDYLMALFLLQKRVDEIADFLAGYFDLYEGKIPVLLDESMVVHHIMHREERSTNINVSPNTLSRFENYTRLLRQYPDPQEAARALYPLYNNSFWFYMNFSTLPK